MNFTKEELLRKHKAERKELRKTCNAALNGTKGDERKEAEENNVKLTEELKLKHEEELEQLMQSLSVEGDTSESQDATSKLVAMGGGELAAKRITKAQKRREKKKALEEADEKEREKIKNSGGPSAKEIETNTISERLKPLNLTIKDMNSDGHCMYRSIVDQLKQKNDSSLSDSPAPHMLLRSMCAAYMKENRHMFEPFMVLDDGETFESYCTKLRNTAEWGGQLELRALANALQQTITVISGEGDDVVMGEEFMRDPDDTLRLTYHRHYLSLGEHYNSTEPAS